MMMWNYSTAFISNEDYKRASFPKKCISGFFLCYAGALVFLKMQYNRNAEVFFKRFFFTKLSPVIAIVPLIAIY